MLSYFSKPALPIKTPAVWLHWCICRSCILFILVSLIIDQVNCSLFAMFKDKLLTSLLYTQKSLVFLIVSLKKFLQ